jgi:myo-inositol-1(or 4)-monophosphatase
MAKQTANKKSQTKKKAPAKKPAAKKKAAAATGGKARPKGTAAKKPAAKKAAVKKPVAKKATASKPSKKKATAKAGTAAEATSKKSAVKKTAPKKSASSKKPAAAKKTKPRETEAKVATKVETSSATENLRNRPRAVEARSKVKPLPRQFLVDLAQSIKDAVLPTIKDLKGREVVGESASGDATFELDRLGERALLNFLKSARAPVAYYSEDAGYSTFSKDAPKHLLVVDPIDGTRAAKNGFEGCVVSIAATRVIERPIMADIDTACVMDLLGDRTFYAERGKGARIYDSGSLRRPKLSENMDLESIAWSMTVPARPAELIFPTAAKLIDLTSLKGGFFTCNSTAHSLTRLLTGQLDVMVDVAGRYMKDIPDAVRDHFINAGRGNVMGIAPYDMAAALLIAQEAGCTVTNAYGKGFDDVMLLDSTEGNHQTIVAASSRELHAKILSFFDTRVRQLETLLKRRAELSK